MFSLTVVELLSHHALVLCTAARVLRYFFVPPTSLDAMTMRSPTVRHRRLGRKLRRLREAAGLIPEAAATQLGWSRPKVNRIENARIATSPTDVADACDLYGADSATKASLIQLCKDASQRGWWTAYSDVFTGSYVGMETESSCIRTWQPLLVPGLLQTEAYTRELFRHGLPDLSESELDRRVSARMARKLALMNDSAPTLHTVIDEAVLRRSSAPGVMVQQIDAILDLTGQDNIVIQVLPYLTGLHRGLEGAFSILEFTEPTDPDVGYVEGPAGDVYVEAADQVRRLILTFERLAGASLSPKESAAFLVAVRSEHDLP
ncbi:helix-turn-helix domain-containing protein [Streptosporangium sp. NBC_01755]|uniref:helix-turn-helix domain-containing protein n=1 Tax=Streptosporangium sp. NBC_01755 TaxID=2975949 RepID=UPI002DD972B0|nr:helix-turn-helix transcriptional regulator [Streptosporangium sp. NBC_01755]WSD03065.1 helix-turn-helix domain-containing protein [Streptosporangium sp. NBC_01755]